MSQHWLSEVLDIGSNFDVKMYKACTRISTETLLLEANDRAAKTSTTAYVHLIGLGLGVWRYCNSQRQWYVKEVKACL